MYRALARGKIERATDCANCGRDGRLFPHFHDYAEPLIVHWLCFLCREKP